MKTTPYLLFALLFITYNASTFAQHYLPGYVITTNRDTLKGFIKDIGPTEKAQRVDFRSQNNPDNPSTIYRPNDLLGYNIDNRYIYQRAIIQLLGDNVIYQKLDSQRVFMRVLVAGHVHLLRLDYDIYNDPLSPDPYKTAFYFWKIANQPVLELDADFVNYQRAIRTYLPTCGLVHAKLKQNHYRDNDEGLIQMTQDANNCFNAPTQVFFNQEKTYKSTLRLLTGLSHATVQPVGSNFEGFDFPRGWGAAAGIEAEFPVYKGLSLGIGLIFISRNSVGIKEVIVPEHFTNGGEVLSLQSSFNLRHLTIPAYAKYTFLSGRFRPHLSIGGSFGTRAGSVIIAQQTQLVSDDPIYLITIKSFNPYDAKADFVDLTLWSGAGIDWQLKNNNKLFLEARYLLGRNDAPKSVNWRITSRTTLYLVGYGLAF